jgi:hypothetical protein
MTAGTLLYQTRTKEMRKYEYFTSSVTDFIKATEANALCH